MWEIVGIIGSLLAVALGYITWFEKRRDKKLERRRIEEKKEQEDFIDKIKKQVAQDTKECLDEKLNEYVKIVDDIESRAELIKTMKELKQELQDHFVESIESEQERLASEIISFAEDLKNAIIKSSVAYEHIHKCYNRYKKLGGNSYIDGVFQYIIKKMEAQDNEKN